MARTTLSQARGAAEALTWALRDKGSSATIILEQRNGHCALDVYDDAGALRETLIVGTRGECWAHAHAMRQALWLLEHPYRAPAPGEDVSAAA